MNRKKLWKRAAAFATALGMLAGIFTGCSGKPEKEDDSRMNGSHAKGRYVEREIGLPEGSGKPFGMIYKENKLVLYTHSEDEKRCQSYVYENAKWSDVQEETWLTDGMNRLEQNIVDVFLGRDGNLYGRAESAGGIRLLKTTGDGNAEDVTPQEDSETNVSGFADAAVLKDGTIGIGNYTDAMVEFYKEGKLVFSTEGIMVGSEEQTMLEVSDQTAAIVGKDGTSIEFYDAMDFEKKNTVKLEQNFGEGFIVPGTDGVWYLVNAEGIYRIIEDGSITEMIMDGGNGMMSNNVTWFLRRFIAGNEEEFYGLYSNSNQEWKLMQYIFDKEAAAVPKETLSVYSLKENRTVTQAIHEFKSRRPEVQIEYITVVTGEEKPTADHIRTLNTELLSGNGADVLILDGLPIESYMEKGVLQDLSEVADKLKKSGVLENVVERTVQKDGKIYAVPARVNIPVIFGTEEEIKACDSINSLKAYAQNNSDKKLFGETSHDLIGMTLFHMFYEELLEENGGINEEKLGELLTSWVQICENGNYKELEEKYFEGESIWHLLDASFCSAQEVLGMDVYVNITELQGLKGSQSSYTGARKTGNSPQGLKGYYVPKTIAGVNASSRKPQLAEEFVECLFTETVQQTDSWDGFPVLSSVLETYPDYVESAEGKKESMKYGGINHETGEEFSVILKYPTKKETEDLITMMAELKSPFIQDRIISDTVQQEMEKCYTGKQSPDETAKVICQKIDMYLSE